MNILVVRIVVKSEKHHVLRTSAVCPFDPGRTGVKPMKDDTS